MHTHTHTHARTHTCMHVHTHTHTRTHTRTHAHMHTHTRARTHTLAHTRTHTHTHLQWPGRLRTSPPETCGKGLQPLTFLLPSKVSVRLYTCHHNYATAVQTSLNKFRFIFYELWAENFQLENFTARGFSRNSSSGKLRKGGFNFRLHGKKHRKAVTHSVSTQKDQGAVPLRVA
mgnify:CR=1 FL=1